jgi:hypothetical protein
MEINMTEHNQIFTSRVFSIPDHASNEPEWYCLTREDVMGPYSSERVAHQALQEFVQLCQRLGWHGDRDLGNPRPRPSALA